METWRAFERASSGSDRRSARSGRVDLSAGTSSSAPMLRSPRCASIGRSSSVQLMRHAKGFHSLHRTRRRMACRVQRSGRRRQSLELSSWLAGARYCCVQANRLSIDACVWGHAARLRDCSTEGLAIERRRRPAASGGAQAVIDTSDIEMIASNGHTCLAPQDTRSVRSNLRQRPAKSRAWIWTRICCRWPSSS